MKTKNTNKFFFFVLSQLTFLLDVLQSHKAEDEHGHKERPNRWNIRNKLKCQNRKWFIQKRTKSSWSRFYSSAIFHICSPSPINYSIDLVIRRLFSLKFMHHFPDVALSLSLSLSPGACKRRHASSRGPIRERQRRGADQWEQPADGGRTALPLQPQAERRRCLASR